MAQGTHAQLLAAGGLYAQLYHRQFRTQHAPDADGPPPVPAESRPCGSQRRPPPDDRGPQRKITVGTDADRAMMGR